MSNLNMFKLRDSWNYHQLSSTIMTVWTGLYRNDFEHINQYILWNIKAFLEWWIANINAINEIILVIVG